ncbi:hypothetical protein ONS95_000743 [Cadophora gregata]|uniref:uncharacterized protein n=1 Tax=Cadophora gregata TaxID=51156 RepID=UPI0026DAFAC8|nr:uncharacterized protein ONS95_000743 [Cadophora gregata]KAK0103078.1 hypothetical protein ONS96_005689 [Cadophora gregata f. sp. sojae]KAK0128793.1 hypothetical protein ONS95_000743 [Cadophora gregata]
MNADITTSTSFSLVKMKIVNANHDPDPAKAERETSLMEYLQHPQIETDEHHAPLSQLVTWSLERKEEYRDLLEESQKAKILEKAKLEEIHSLALLEDAGAQASRLDLRGVRIRLLPSSLLQFGTSGSQVELTYSASSPRLPPLSCPIHSYSRR